MDWDSILASIDDHTKQFWNRPLRHRLWTRQQSTETWKQLRQLQGQLIRATDRQSLTAQESFLLKAAAPLYELGWQHPDALSMSESERYLASGIMVLNAPADFGLLPLGPALIDALIGICTSVGNPEVVLSDEHPGMNNEPIRQNYLAALFQLADLLLVQRAKPFAFDNLSIIPSISEARLALSKHIDMVNIKAEHLQFSLRLQTSDETFAPKVANVLEAPIRQWLLHHYQWLDHQHGWRLYLQPFIHRVSNMTFPPTLIKDNKILQQFMDTVPTISLIEVEKAYTQPPATIKPSSIEFFIHIDNHAQIRASSPQGKTRPTPVDQDMLESLKLAQQLVRSKVTSREMLKSFGKQLYKILFPSEINILFTQTRALAGNNPVHIHLAFEVQDLAGLPWEFLFDSMDDQFMGTYSRFCLSRYLPYLNAQTLAIKQDKLRMLLILANPKTSQLHSFEPRHWEMMIRSSVGKSVEIQIATPTRHGIDTILQTFQPDIVQFVGHGDFQDGIGYLALENDNGGLDPVNEYYFADTFLSSATPASLVCLTACHSATSGSIDHYSGIAPRLIKAGVPMVIAMQYEVTIPAAKDFFEAFYSALITEQQSVAVAVQRGRYHLGRSFGMEGREFATPTLYTRTDTDS